MSKSRFKILITRRIPNAGLDLIRKKLGGCQINPHDRILARKEILKSVRGCAGILSLLTDKIDAEAMDAAGPNLKIISNYAVGYDNIDISEAKKRKIMVTNTPSVLTDTTAEMAWALLFSVARRTAESDRFTREGKFKGWGPLVFLGQNVSGRTLGIIGAGRIGTAFGLMSKGFNMKVLYVSRNPNKILEKELGAKKTGLTTLLKKSDFISLHVPLTEKTRHLISKKEFALMKPTTILINTSRGAVINEKDLVRALKGGKIFGAGLDVYEREPQLTPGLSQLPNVVLAPHIASATTETRSRMALMAAHNLIAGLQGKKPGNSVV